MRRKSKLNRPKRTQVHSIRLPSTLQNSLRLKCDRLNWDELYLYILVFTHPFVFKCFLTELCGQLGEYKSVKNDFL